MFVCGVRTKNMKICKSLNIKPNKYESIELLSSNKAYQSSNLTITITDIVRNIETFCEICNVSVLGEPQLGNYNGMTDLSCRGSSYFFNKQNTYNWAVFGSSAGQGLIIDLYNPHSNEIKVEILLEGLETECDNIGLCHFENNRILFHRVECLANKITTARILAGRAGALKPKYLQVDSNINNNIEIVDIKVLKKQQVRFKLDSNYFSKLKPCDFDVFGSAELQGLEISFDNTSSCNVTKYITIIGQPASSDLLFNK